MTGSRESNRVPSVRTAPQDASLFVVAGLLNADGAAYRGVRIQKTRPMKMRAAARGDQSHRRYDGRGWEETKR